MCHVWPTNWETRLDYIRIYSIAALISGITLTFPIRPSGDEDESPRFPSIVIRHGNGFFGHFFPVRWFRCILSRFVMMKIKLGKQLDSQRVTREGKAVLWPDQIRERNWVNTFLFLFTISGAVAATVAVASCIHTSVFPIYTRNYQICMRWMRASMGDEQSTEVYWCERRVKLTNGEWEWPTFELCRMCAIVRCAAQCRHSRDYTFLFFRFWGAFGMHPLWSRRHVAYSAAKKKT